MDKDYAIEILKALAYCTIKGLSCVDCSMWEASDDELGGWCRGWDDEDVIKAIRVLDGDITDY